MRRHPHPAAVLLVAGVVVACSATRADTGLEAWMRVRGAQFFKGPMPADTHGPAVAAVSLLTNTVAPGFLDKPLSGAVAPNATAAAVGIAGDQGYWVLLAGPPGVDAPTFPTFDAVLSFAPTVPPGLYSLVVRAVDGSGNFGPPFPEALTVTSTGIPAGALVVHLEWDTESDLDLHVVDPSGTEIFYRNITSYMAPGPGQPGDAGTPGDYGYLDFDSNAGCVIDGRRQENVIWKDGYPTGHYVARVDTKSLCEEVEAHWTVEVVKRGTPIASARGMSLGSDTRFNHDRGAGITAVELDVP
jgi:hypothetical protein